MKNKTKILMRFITFGSEWIRIHAPCYLDGVIGWAGASPRYHHQRRRHHPTLGWTSGNPSLQYFCVDNYFFSLPRFIGSSQPTKSKMTGIWQMRIPKPSPVTVPISKHMKIPWPLFPVVKFATFKKSAGTR